MLAELTNDEKFLVVTLKPEAASTSSQALELRSMADVMSLCAAGDWKQCGAQGNFDDRDIFIPCRKFLGIYKHFKKLWINCDVSSLGSKDFWKDHKKEAFPTPLQGTSKLIWSESGEYIKIARRTKDTRTTRNCVQISDTMRELFFQELRQSSHFTKGEWVIKREKDPDLYYSWLSLVAAEYRSQYIAFLAKENGYYGVL